MFFWNCMVLSFKVTVGGLLWVLVIAVIAAIIGLAIDVLSKDNIIR